MVKSFIAASILALFAGSAAAQEPWLTYGQTLPPASGTVYNPAANFRGAIGEVQTPYTVPIGKVLVITRWGVEGYPVAGGVVLTIYTGPATPAGNHVFLHSVLADTQYNETLDNEYKFPAGTVINVMIQSAETPKQVSGWVVSGYLDDAP